MASLLDQSSSNQQAGLLHTGTQGHQTSLLLLVLLLVCALAGGFLVFGALSAYRLASWCTSWRASSNTTTARRAWSIRDDATTERGYLDLERDASEQSKRASAERGYLDLERDASGKSKRASHRWPSIAAAANAAPARVDHASARRSLRDSSGGVSAPRKRWSEHERSCCMHAADSQMQQPPRAEPHSEESTTAIDSSFASELGARLSSMLESIAPRGTTRRERIERAVWRELQLGESFTNILNALQVEVDARNARRGTAEAERKQRAKLEALERPSVLRATLNEKNLHRLRSIHDAEARGSRSFADQVRATIVHEAEADDEAYAEERELEMRSAVAVRNLIHRFEEDLEDPQELIQPWDSVSNAPQQRFSCGTALPMLPLPPPPSVISVSKRGHAPTLILEEHEPDKLARTLSLPSQPKDQLSDGPTHCDSI